MNRLVLSLEEDAIDYQIGEKYSKEELIKFISRERKKAKVKKSSFGYDRKALSYLFKNDDSSIKIIIKKRYQTINRDFIKVFEDWHNEDKKNKRNRILVIFASVAILCTTCKFHKSIYNGLGVIFTNKRSAEDECIDELEFSIQVHGMEDYAKSMGVLVIKHDCVCEINTGLPIEMEIANYCKEYELGEEVEKEAINKYNYYISGDYITAGEISLNTVYKESQKRR